jgi:hypothetical protein
MHKVLVHTEVCVISLVNVQKCDILLHTVQSMSMKYARS